MSDEDDKRYWLKINRTCAHPVGRGRGRAPGLRPRGGAHPRAVAGLNAYAKGKSLGLFEPAPEEVNEVLADVCRTIPPLNAPFHYPLTEGLTEIEVTDARHPLFGRRFKVFSWPTFSHRAGFVTIIYRDPMRLRIPLSATDLTPPRQGCVSKLTLASVTEPLNIWRARRFNSPEQALSSLGENHNHMHGNYRFITIVDVLTLSGDTRHHPVTYGRIS